MIVIIILNSSYLNAQIKGIIICNNNVNIHESANINSKTIELLSSGELVTIIDSTKERFNIGIEEVFCKDFPFIKIKNNKGNLGWVSGQFVFKIIEKQNNIPQGLITINSNFSLNSHKFSLFLGRNFGIGSTDEDGLTGCEEFYPLILYDEEESKYSIIKNIKNHN